MTKKRARKGRKAHRKPVTLSAAPEATNRWDMGPDTPAQRAGKVIESADYIDPETGKRINPNNVKRARRIDLIETYHKRERPILDTRQFRAAQLLRNAYEATQKSPPAIKKVQVDTTPKPDANVAIMVDRISAFHRAARHIPPECRPVIDVVVLQNRAIAAHPAYKAWNHAKGVALLQRGLDAIAEGLRL
jgi:hypothetical protein